MYFYNNFTESDLPPEDIQLLTTIQDLSVVVSNAFHNLSLSDAVIVNQMPTIIKNVNANTDKIGT